MKQRDLTRRRLLRNLRRYNTVDAFDAVSSIVGDPVFLRVPILSSPSLGRSGLKEKIRDILSGNR